MGDERLRATLVDLYERMSARYSKEKGALGTLRGREPTYLTGGRVQVK